MQPSNMLIACADPFFPSGRDIDRAFEAGASPIISRWLQRVEYLLRLACGGSCYAEDVGEQSISTLEDLLEAPELARTL